MSKEKRGGTHTVVVTDRVYEYGYLRGIVEGVFAKAGGLRFKSDDASGFGLQPAPPRLSPALGVETPWLRPAQGARYRIPAPPRVAQPSHPPHPTPPHPTPPQVVLNLSLLSLLLDFGLSEAHGHLLNLPFLSSLPGDGPLDKRQLQVEVSNWIAEFDQKNTADSVTRIKVSPQTKPSRPTALAARPRRLPAPT